MLPLGTPAPRFALSDTVSGRRVALEDFASSPALLIAFVCNHCPFVKHILDEFVVFARDFGPRGLAVVAISSNDVDSYPDDAPVEMTRIATLKRFTFPYLYDESQQVAKAYQAICTPDFFLFDRNRRLAYRGQFDGSRPGTIFRSPVRICAQQPRHCCAESPCPRNRHRAWDAVSNGNPARSRIGYREAGASSWRLEPDQRFTNFREIFCRFVSD